jgi:two-component system copper resistance phosphate regulon response regulator CusR
MRILIVEDDERVADFLRRGLSEEGYEVEVCHRGDSARDLVLQRSYETILLDWNLPGMDGLSLLKHWRSANIKTPVILLTAKSGVEATVAALDAGADDYVVKPFSLEELIARVRAHYRRLHIEPAQEVSIGKTKIDLKKRVMTRDAESFELSGREFALLELLLQHRGELLSRAKILEQVWETTEDPVTNVVDVYIRALRNKLDGPNAPSSVIETIRGRGYRLKRPEEIT